jgi:signal peptidase I
MLRIVKVSGESMAPTLESGERVLAWTPFSKQCFKRGKIVTLSYPGHPSSVQYYHSSSYTRIAALKHRQPELFIKRILGLPGDTVRIPADQLAFHILDAAGLRIEQDGDELVWSIPDEHVFVRGDGLYSSDSVTWGPIPITQLQQIVFCQFPSFRRI